VDVLEVPEAMRCVLLCILEVVEVRFCSLEVLEVIRCVLPCLLVVVELEWAQVRRVEISVVAVFAVSSQSKHYGHQRKTPQQKYSTTGRADTMTASKM